MMQNGAFILFEIGSQSCPRQLLDDCFTQENGGFTPVVAATDQEIINQARQWLIHNLTETAYSRYASDDPALIETIALIRQLENLLSPSSEAHDSYDYMQELARLTPGVIWQHADVEEPLKLRRESAVELVGMGVIIFASFLYSVGV
ncbi:hypothetical protein Pmar_PMAR022573 [Perkinsus marinus ATCC 50983]|uniref:Uncharacterized protein n=1 Tax=Perkinsus marinus (strain ATCC 50983 / TXsc) TaxID=423536 RepID=C5KFH7_PERM5|nr:hypothetical protein Pmar_PMAR022573 [Perkinsus marinus ATCC 50983]EER16726.1 hypothetical protein Pmar_PMAR022573 [Perkinsus marinus ATCC 50983]|eukprot:XP_002784930.1 hypothetical protein Pmar_PMAR022573 [Perkinsus marinus ATCC 50983]